MDKKKVKELVGKAKDYILAYQKSKKDSDLAMAFLNMQSAERELSKSDWVSVEDELPEYCEKVMVCNKNDARDIWISFRTKSSFIETTAFDFAVEWGHMGITHWHKIDKLEV